jgi:hypothetical protein
MEIFCPSQQVDHNNSQGRYVITEKGNQRIRRILQLLVAALLIPAATLSIDLESLTIPLF